MRLQVKPLSANQMYYRGKRSKSAAYIAYQNDIRDQLMGIEWPFGTDPVTFEIEGGFSNRAADLDNIIKPILDTLQVVFEIDNKKKKKKQFNDNKVYKLILNKEIVEKGKEYVDIKVYPRTMS